MAPNSTEPMIEKRQFGNAEAVDISVTNHAFARPKALWVGGAGNVVVQMGSNGDTILFGCAAGTLIPVFVTKVYKVNTTATLILGLE